MVLGLLRDDRAERERRRADEAVEAAKASEQKANEAQQLIGQLRQQAQQQAEASQKLVREFQAQVKRNASEPILMRTHFVIARSGATRQSRWVSDVCSGDEIATLRSQ